jgi:hypothetical protein
MPELDRDPGAHHIALLLVPAGDSLRLQDYNRQ